MCDYGKGLAVDSYFAYEPDRNAHLDNPTRTVRLLQSSYIHVFGELSDVDGEVAPVTSYGKQEPSGGLSSRFHHVPKYATAVTHLPDLSFGFRTLAFLDKRYYDTRNRTAKRMKDATSVPERYTKAVWAFLRTSAEMSMEVLFYEKPEAYLLVATGDLDVYGEYHVLVEMAMAKGNEAAFRRSAFAELASV